MVADFRANTVRTENNILFLMTDGYPNCGREVYNERQSIDDAGIRAIVVGVSSGFNAAKVSCSMHLWPLLSQPLYYDFTKANKGKYQPFNYF